MALINLTPKSISTGITVYPIPLSSTVVAVQRRRKQIGQPSGVPSGEPSKQPRPLDKSPRSKARDRTPNLGLSIGTPTSPPRGKPRQYLIVQTNKPSLGAPSNEPSKQLRPLDKSIRSKAMKRTLNLGLLISTPTSPPNGKPRQKLSVPTNKPSFRATATQMLNASIPRSEQSGKPSFRASGTLKKVRFTTGHHLSGPPQGIHSGTALLSREYHIDTTPVILIREKQRDPVTALLSREYRSTTPAILIRENRRDPATAPIGRKYRSTTPVMLIREKRRDPATALLSREYRSTEPAILIWENHRDHASAPIGREYRNRLSVPPKASNTLVKGNPIILNNLASVSGVPN